MRIHIDNSAKAPISVKWRISKLFSSLKKFFFATLPLKKRVNPLDYVTHLYQGIQEEDEPVTKK